jgi:hypothetical protein
MQRFCAQDPKPHPMTLNQANQGFGAFCEAIRKMRIQITKNALVKGNLNSKSKKIRSGRHRLQISV